MIFTYICLVTTLIFCICQCNIISKFLYHSACVSPGELVVTIADCFGILCESASCPNHPDAECVASCCEGTVKFIDEDRNDLTESCRSM